ncbi:MAG: hypothetical protein ACLPI9_05045 [Halobacteriota archaeon]|jgi:hypothetical protein
MREPLIEYTNSNPQETIMMLLCNLTGGLMVYRDHSVAFSCTCLNGGHAFRIDGRRDKRTQ